MQGPGTAVDGDGMHKPSVSFSPNTAPPASPTKRAQCLRARTHKLSTSRRSLRASAANLVTCQTDNECKCEPRDSNFFPPELRHCTVRLLTVECEPFSLLVCYVVRGWCLSALCLAWHETLSALASDHCDQVGAPLPPPRSLLLAERLVVMRASWPGPTQFCPLL
jgi:hypothetical protein